MLAFVPSGLDGNPNPVVSSDRTTVVHDIARVIDTRRDSRVLRVGVDGIDGSGKSTFADELAAVLERRDVPVIRSTTDWFHNPRAVRYRLGKDSAEGFYRDSYDLDRLTRSLLDPLSSTPPGRFRRAAFDEPSDSPVSAPYERAADGSVLLFDGLFLARPELRDYWDCLIYVDGRYRVARQRIEWAVSECPSGPHALVHLAAAWGRLERYVEGLRIYAAECRPIERADIVVDNNDFATPTRCPASP